MRGERGFTLMETVVSIGMVAMVMAFTGLLFQRSFNVLRVLDDKERTRQAARMGLDRITSELREATRIVATADFVEFEKIDPTAVIVVPPPEPDPVDDGFVPPTYTPQTAYPDNRRLIVRYETIDENLVRRVRRLNSGSFTDQVVVAGVNSFTVTEVVENVGEVTVEVSVVDNGRVKTVFGRVLCPCIREEFDG
jgi:type II secretory pathway pseudopilin PulG